MMTSSRLFAIVLAVSVLALAPTMAAHASVVLFDNGPLVNSPGTGAGGADESRLQDSSLGMNVFGFTASTATVFRVADDFTVTAGGWSIDEVVFFAYQTGSPITSTFDSLTYRVWDGEPGGLGSSVVFGDTTTNRLLSGTWTGIYRVLESTPGGTTRPIMALTGDADFFLGPGTYWIDWQFGGSLALGPFVPPVTINGVTTTGNALQFDEASWYSIEDVGPQGLPFQLIGEPVPEPGSLALLGMGLAGFAARRRGWSRRRLS